MGYPLLPKRVEGAGGKITVRLLSRVRIGKHHCWGSWELERRRIEIDKTATPRQRWRTFYHELCHAMLDDAGLSQLLSDAGNEALCEAYATSRMREMCGVLGIDE